MAKKPTTKKKKPAPKKKVTRAVALVKPQPPQHLSLTNPKDVMAFGQVLKNYIAKNNLSVDIKGNTYSLVDGWKFAGLSFGLTAIPSRPVARQVPGQYITVMYKIGVFLNRKTQQEYKKEYIAFTGFTSDVEVIDNMRKRIQPTKETTHPYFLYECECKIVRLTDGMAVGFGLGMCSNMEDAKVEFEEYAVASMAQTRTIGKAYRNLIGFIMKGAGIEGTPAEEMEGVKDDDPIVKKQEEANRPTADRPAMTDTQLGKADARIRGGEDILETCKQQFYLTKKQLVSLEEAEKFLISKQQQK